MANTLPTEKKVQIVSSLAENASIRGIERMTGVHRDTIMRLGVRVGETCQAILDERMHGLECNDIQIDELWGFIGKKNKHVQAGEDRNGVGDVWTFVAIDRETKLIPSFVVGKRDSYHANAFLEDLVGELSRVPKGATKPRRFGAEGRSVAESERTDEDETTRQKLKRFSN